MPARCLRQQIEVECIVAILKERPLAPVAALRHVVRDARQNHAGKAGHGIVLSRVMGSVNLGVYGRVTVI